MNDYLNLGHMEKVSPYEESTSASYFLPHHAVIKEASSTTKLRVVFDGSAKTTTGISLNDILMVGPTIQQDLYSLMTRFRTHMFVLTADITKMYRQINVDPSQTNLQQILWRPSPEEPIAIYALKTVTYGTSSAPFLATRCLQQVAIDGQISFPIASVVALKDFYVDDLLTGTNSITNAKILRDQLIALLSAGGFELRKWASNAPDLLTDFPVTTTTSSMLHIHNDETTKTLGLIWNSKSDSFQYTVQLHNPKRGTTKRSILSTIARIFDPLGLIGPVILKAKIMMQNLWQLRLDWDESVPIRIHTEWTQFEQQLAVLNTLAIPRRVVGGDESSQIQLHGFCDASEAAYGACLYIRSTATQEEHFVNLLCSKSKVAPLKVLSLPRLELCGAVLLAQLAQRTLDTLDLKIDQCFFWTDSTIVLAWLNSSAGNWKTFIANRVGEIQRLTNICNWHHVNTEDNPADHVSRGLSPTSLLNNDNWWKGPSWLSENTQCWPSMEMQETFEAPERRIISIILTSLQMNCDLFDRYSSLTKLQHVVAYCFRFVANARIQHSQWSLGPLSVLELNSALHCLLKLAQHQEFKREIEDLMNKKEVHYKSHLASLHPFIDSSGLLRVGGRLLEAPVAYDRKHPILLPARHCLTRLIVTYEHVKQLHAGPQSLLAAVRARYWPLSARNLVRQVVRSCIRCIRTRPVPIEPLMGDLPQSRVSPARPFLNCGVDFCGPFYLRVVRRRGGMVVKTYIALFVCFATKAVHLEVVSDLTTEAFLAAFKRFIARRGKCKHIFSDNATNFVGAKGELAELRKLMLSDNYQSTVTETLANDEIIWHFIPARSPHFGGLWEAAVKSTKHHLRRVAGGASLTFDEMTTLVVQIEACLNSRPLTPLSNDPNDLCVLTPGHFLIGNALTAIAEPELTSIPQSRLSRWQHVQQLTQHFWTRWSGEYLSQLQQRSKWRSPSHQSIVPGSLVLIKEDNLPPLKWCLGRIVEVHPGKDNVVRVVSVKTKGSILKRAVTRLCALPMESS